MQRVILTDSPWASEVGAGKSKIKAEKTPDDMGRSGTPETGRRNAERDTEREIALPPMLLRVPETQWCVSLDCFSR